MPRSIKKWSLDGNTKPLHETGTPIERNTDRRFSGEWTSHSRNGCENWGSPQGDADRPRHDEDAPHKHLEVHLLLGLKEKTAQNDRKERVRGNERRDEADHILIEGDKEQNVGDAHEQTGPEKEPETSPGQENIIRKSILLPMKRLNAF